jgi:O-antigen ligase
MTAGSPARHDDLADRRALAWILALSVVGYPLVGMFGVIFGLDATLSSIPFRLFVIVMSLGVIYRATLQRTRFNPDTLIIGFFAIYLFRLGWDVVIAGIDGATTAMVFFLATVLIPGIALMIIAHARNERSLAQTMFLVGSAVSVLAVVLMLLGFGGSRSMTEETGRLSFDTVNPILFGHAGATTIIAALAAWQQSRPTERSILLVGAGFGAACLLLAASRGPLLSLIVALTVYAYVRRKWGWVVLAALAGASFLPSLLSSDSFELAARFSNIEEDDSALERLAVQANALQQFLDNPLFGNAFVEPVLGEYPHNLVLESGMALGVPGLLLFLVICIRGWLRAIAELRSGLVLIPLLFFQYLVAAQLSGALWGASAFWMSTILLMGYRAEVPSRRRAGRIVAAPMVS